MQELTDNLHMCLQFHGILDTGIPVSESESLSNSCTMVIRKQAGLF